MDKPITKVVKSKSSNSTSESKKNCQKNNKKSRSNAEFQAKNTIYTHSIQPLLKKRGVYVEKKATTTKIPINTRDRSPDVPIIKPPCPPRPIPRPGRKRFLASVLTILDKSTAGTQCPDGTDRLESMDKIKKKIRKRRDEDIHEVSLTTPNISKRKSRYRSRVLNSVDNDVEPLLVLRSKKDIAQTPSNNSDFTHDQNAVGTNVGPKSLDANSSIATNNRKVRLNDNEPSTMVPDIPKIIDRNFYNFFVDVLKTSFSVYNVKTEFKKELPVSANSSKIGLQANDSGTGKFNNIHRINEREHEESPDVSRKPSSKYFYSIQPDENQQWDDKQLLEHFQPVIGNQYTVESPKRRRKLKSDSFNYRKAKPLPKTTSLPIPRRRTEKKEKKKDFINSLKQQLQMKEDMYQPQNFYQALKVIAKNKRRCQQAIDFRDAKGPSEGDVHVCQFKRRKVLSGKKSNYYPETSFDPSIFNPYFKTRYKKNKILVEREEEIDESNHSLEVIGYDYETKKTKVPVHSNLPSRRPSPTTLIQDYDVSVLIDYCESGTDAMMPVIIQSAQLKHVYDAIARF